MSKPTMLWIDCTSGIPDAWHRLQCESVFRVALAVTVEHAATELPRVKPNVLCFDFDYPDQIRLQALQSLKQAHPRLPILMLTLEHSESLAVWAFRSRVWNYLVKPVPALELSENLTALAGLGGRASPPRVAQLLNASVPGDLPVKPIAPDIARLQPALHYVTRHYHERVSAIVAAKYCGLTRFDFSRKFRAAFGMTFRDYLLRVRIMEAGRMLTEGKSVTSVAYSVGFNDASHFTRMFKRVTGSLPSDFQLADTATQPDSAWAGRVLQPAPRRRSSDSRLART